MTRLEEIKTYWQANYGSALANGDIDFLLTAMKEKEEEIANLKCVMGNLLKQLDKRDMVEGMEGDDYNS
jgi:hypothetical protein